MSSLLRVAVSAPVAKNSLKIALVVGSLLNLINQGENFWHDGTLAWGHLLLNYAVPYCVASYSAAKNKIESGGGLPPE